MTLGWEESCRGEGIPAMNQADGLVVKIDAVPWAL